MPRIQNIHQPAELKNYAINGALDFWQEKGGTTTTVNTATGTSGYSADMFAYQSGGGVTTHNYSLVRSTDVPTFSQSGFQSQYSILFTNITGTPSFAAGDWREPFLYKMEGLDYAKLHGKVVTFGFWVKASVTGTYSFAMKNASFNRSYVTTFTISNANTWEFKAITVQLDSSGTWGFDTSLGIQIHIGSITGTTFQTTTLNQWQSGNFVMASTATNYQATSNATVRLAQFSIVEGSLGVGPTGFQRAGKTVQQEETACKRYYRTLAHVPATPQTSTLVAAAQPLSPAMRATPTVGQTGVLNLQGTNSYNSAQTGVGLGSNNSTADSFYMTNIPNFPATLPPLGHALFLGVPTNNGNVLTLDARL